MSNLTTTLVVAIEITVFNTSSCGTATTYGTSNLGVRECKTRHLFLLSCFFIYSSNLLTAFYFEFYALSLSLFLFHNVLKLHSDLPYGTLSNGHNNNNCTEKKM